MSNSRGVSKIIGRQLASSFKTPKESGYDPEARGVVRVDTERC